MVNIPMKCFFAILLFLTTAISSQSQDIESLYTSAIEELQNQNYQKALDKLLQLDSLINYDTSVDTTYASYIIEPILYSCAQVGDYEIAIKYATKCADIVKNVYGKNHPVYATSLSNLAGFYSVIGNYSETIRLETEAMEIRKKTLGPEHPDYALSLNGLANCYSELGNYSEAIRLGTEAMEIHKKVLGVEHPNYALSLNNLANYYCKLGQYFEAIRLGTEAMEICKKVLGSDHPSFAKSLSNLAVFYSEIGNYSEAIRLGAEAMEICKNLLGPEHPEYALSLNNLAACYSEMGNYSEAIRLGTEAMEIRKEVLGVDHPDYATSLSNLANYYSHLGNYSEAIRLGAEAMEISKKILGQEHPDYALSLSNLANFYSYLGNYSEALRLRTETMEIHKKVLGVDHPYYATSLSNLAGCLSDLGNYSEAMRLETEAMEIYKKVLGVEHPNYALSLNNLANYYCKLGHYFEAIRLGTEAMEIRKKVLGSDHPSFAKSLSNLAGYNSVMGNYSEAIKIETEAMKIRKKLLGPEHPDYALSLNNLASCYSDQGNYSEAIRLGTEAIGIYKKVLGSGHPDYATSLSNLANYYSHLGNYSEAIRLGGEAMEIRKKILGPDHPDYALSLSNLANYYSHNGNYSEAIRLGSEAMEIRKRLLGPKHPDYALSLSNIANYHVYLGDNSEAMRLGIMAMDIRKEVLGPDHPDYATSLSNLAVCYSELGDYSEAIRLGSEAMEIYKKVLGTEHPYYLLFLGNMASFYFNIGSYNEAMSFLLEHLSLVRKNVFSTFLGLTAKERQMYWNKYCSNFSQYLPFFISQSNITNGASTLYDHTALFAKGLLLSTEQEITKLIQESGDDDALQVYSELRKNRQILNVQYSKPIAERYLKCDSLEKVSNDQERKLVARVKEFGDYTHNLNITWQDVQNTLNENDIAIEFLSYREKDGEMHYIALTLCKNDTAPILTPLFVETKLFDTSGKDGTYQTESADSLIWGPISSVLEGKSNVYFSASGILNNIGIEYLHSMDGKECYRLSSTRELATHKPYETLRNAILYGDIDYDATYVLIESSIPSPTKDYAMNETSKYRRNLDYRSLNNGVSPLPGSRIELNEISALMKQLGMPCDAMTGIQASEESFKVLFGQHKSLLHISTHGFYYNDEEANNLKPHIRHILVGDDRLSYAEDRSMLRCGLCFAGANQILLGKSKPTEGQEDGILNALEIAQTDLRGLDLVVLSACQTALGDVAQGEGVFGLQRGFKKAGAKSILMTLWNVDDLTTQLLMVEFYKNYLAGKSKQESLHNAQQYIREYKDENGNKLFESPYYWAGFILLDALD